MNQQKRERACARGKREDRKGNRSKTRERVLQTPPEAGDRPLTWTNTGEGEEELTGGGNWVRGQGVRQVALFLFCLLPEMTKKQLSEPENELETADLQTDGETGGERRDRLTCCHHCTRQRKKWLVFRSSNLRVHNFYTRLARDFFVCLFDWLIFDSMNSSVQFCAKQQKTNELGVRKLTSDAEKDVLIEQRPMVCNELIYSFVSLLSFT